MEIANIAVIVKLSTTMIDLDKIHDSIDNTEFTTQASRWLKMRLMPENLYVAFYRSGKFSCTGIKRVEQIEEVADRVLSLLKEIGLEYEIQNIDINTMIFIDNIQTRFNLGNLLCNLDAKKASYEPEQFPALIYRDWGAALLLFSTGKVTIAGCKSKIEAELALKNFKELIGIAQ